MAQSFLRRQLFVACSSQLAALSVGAAVSFPGVLLQQLNSTGTTIHMELDTVSWIGSVHGLAGIPSIIMPSIMQWKGRKLSFLLACLLSVIGWLLAVTANSSTMILISESFHGLGNNSLLAVCLLSISEMVGPQYRNVSMVSFHIFQTFGMAMVCVLGRFLHWKTVSVVVGIPVLLSLLMGLQWPESPSWLAYTGQFEKSEQAFIRLRGTDESSRLELRELITAQKEDMKRKRKFDLTSVLQRDFYLPTIHMFMLLCLTYWSGSLVILIYSIQMIQTATNNENVAFYGGVLMNVILFVCTLISVFSIRYFPNKSVLLTSTCCTVSTLLGTALANYLQTVGVIPSDSLITLYLLVAYMFATGLGVLPIVFTVAVELMPVKHRGIGGAMYVIFTCVLHSSSLKAAPYLFLYIKLYGTLLLFALNALVCGLYIWKFVPETKGRTLQEIENSYTNRKTIYKSFSNEETLSTLI